MHKNPYKHRFISPLIFRTFTQQFLTGNLKVDSQLSSRIHLFTKLEITDTNVWSTDAKDLILSRNAQFEKHKDPEDDIINMVEFLVDNIFVVFGGKVFQQINGIPMGTNCALLVADIFCTHTKRNSYSLCSQLERKI